ncbi:patatin-like phospholipase family protein [Shewanella sp. MMG014]|uniref:patatin-like phospholipase family protein n=1 Tax=Shewanella sp. MMG014 TaxID=2822691 RepID=UPI001B364003|nr:patatin-like phospholipase family protein [Shewanella sp. MMG014]MBQ4891590.1 patatin-like phospholipase family protein [Shewanella sp. MMG014]
MNHVKQIPAILLLMLIAGCSTTHTLDLRVPEQGYEQATVDGEAKSPNAEPLRFWAGEPSTFLYSDLTKSTPLTVQGDALNILVLSGGGANGAFGTGIVNGLYEQNKLDQYSIVTGVSAGALIAPFAFLGGDEIPRLKQVMLGVNDKDIIGKRNFLNTLFKDSFSKGDNMIDFIAEVYSQEMIEQIAKQHQAGRRLFIGTTQFDSGRLSIWNIGEIANSDMDNKVKFIQQLIAASSSIPGVFPPQFIKVDYQGEEYEELHVDGGLSAQMFFEPVSTDYEKVSKILGLEKQPYIHVIRNGMFHMPYEATPDKGMALLTRSIKSLTVLQSRGDLYKMLYDSERQQIDLSFTYISNDFDAPKGTKDMFDAEYMQALYNYGYNKAVNDQVWSKQLP